MNAIVFPGQGSQYVGMGLEFKSDPEAMKYIELANQTLGFDIFKVMCEGTEDQLKETRVTQPAVFLHSIIKYISLKDSLKAHIFSGHSLGEITALVAAKALNFVDGLKLVSQRAEAMQSACEIEDSTMAAVLGLDDMSIIDTCKSIGDRVVAANFNCPGQVVISLGSDEMEKVLAKFKAIGAKRVLPLKVGGAFHSKFMQPASEKLNKAIDSITFSIPESPVYQNFDAKWTKDPFLLASNLKKQLTSPVLWTATVQNMVKDGAKHFTQVGGKAGIVTGLIRKIDRGVETESK